MVYRSRPAAQPLHCGAPPTERSLLFEEAAAARNHNDLSYDDIALLHSISPATTLEASGYACQSEAGYAAAERFSKVVGQRAQLRREEALRRPKGEETLRHLWNLPPPVPAAVRQAKDTAPSAVQYTASDPLRGFSETLSALREQMAVLHAKPPTSVVLDSSGCLHRADVVEVTPHYQAAQQEQPAASGASLSSQLRSSADSDYLMTLRALGLKDVFMSIHAKDTRGEIIHESDVDTLLLPKSVIRYRLRRAHQARSLGSKLRDDDYSTPFPTPPLPQWLVCERYGSSLEDEKSIQDKE